MFSFLDPPQKIAVKTIQESVKHDSFSPFSLKAVAVLIAVCAIAASHDKIHRALVDSANFIKQKWEDFNLREDERDLYFINEIERLESRVARLESIIQTYK